MSTRRGAIVGLGAIALHGHLPRWRVRPGVEIVAAADLRHQGGEGAVDPESGLPLYRSLDAVLDAHALDFVDVCTPPSSHAAIIATAMARGLDVLCEKPLVVDEAGMQTVAEAMRGGERTLFTVHNWRYAPILSRITAWILEGRIGRPLDVQWRVERTGPSAIVGEGENWRLDPAVAGGGILVDHGWHGIYVILEWLGVRPTAVQARLEKRRFHDLDVEDTADVRIEAGEARAQMFLTWAGSERRNAARIEGTDGVIEMLDDHLLVSTSQGTERVDFPSPLSGGSSHPDWFDATADAFFAEVDDPALRGRNLEVAGDCYRVIAAAQASALAGERRQLA